MDKNSPERPSKQNMENEKLKLLVSSPVYGIEELLDRVFSLLTSFGYDVWMSHKGTVPVNSQYTAYQNCINAVENCDLFLGIITTRYGSGITQVENKSITHLEILKAIELDKPRWILAHDHVIYARQLLQDLGYESEEQRSKLNLKDKAISLGNIKVIGLYEEATKKDLPPDDANGNWAHKFSSDEDALLFSASQFSRYQEAEMFIRENFPQEKDMRNRLQSIGNNHG